MAVKASRVGEESSLVSPKPFFTTNLFYFLSIITAIHSYSIGDIVDTLVHFCTTHNLDPKRTVGPKK